MEIFDDSASWGWCKAGLTVDPFIWSFSSIFPLFWPPKPGTKPSSCHMLVKPTPADVERSWFSLKLSEAQAAHTFNILHPFGNVWNISDTDTMVGMESCELCLGLVSRGSASSRPTRPDGMLSEPRLDTGVGEIWSRALDSFCPCIFFGHRSWYLTVPACFTRKYLPAVLFIAGSVYTRADSVARKARWGRHELAY